MPPSLYGGNVRHDNGFEIVVGLHYSEIAQKSPKFAIDRHTLLNMPEISESHISCPYCGESISILVDDSLPEQNYVEDCQVCCRPIVLDVAVDLEGDVAVSARCENE